MVIITCAVIILFSILAFIEAALCLATKMDKEQQELSDNMQLKFLKEIKGGH